MPLFSLKWTNLFLVHVLVIVLFRSMFSVLDTYLELFISWYIYIYTLFTADVSTCLIG